MQGMALPLSNQTEKREWARQAASLRSSNHPIIALITLCWGNRAHPPALATLALLGLPSLWKLSIMRWYEEMKKSEGGGIASSSACHVYSSVAGMFLTTRVPRVCLCGWNVWASIILHYCGGFVIHYTFLSIHFIQRHVPITPDHEPVTRCDELCQIHTSVFPKVWPAWVTTSWQGALGGNGNCK